MEPTKKIVQKEKKMREFYLRGNIQENIIVLMSKIMWIPIIFRNNPEIHQKVRSVVYNSSGDVFDSCDELINMIVENTKPDKESSYRPEAVCPLCGHTPQTIYSTGFAYPEGLRRHLEGYGNAKQCIITSIISELGLHYQKK